LQKNRNIPLRRSIDMRRLEQFVTVARTGSLGKAAQELGMTQPTLTRNMRGLETDVGTSLFARGPAGTVLTPAGGRFLPRAEELLNSLERALGEIEEDGAQATLKLGISPNFHFDLIPGAINRNVQENASLNIHVISATREQIADDLRRKEMDLGFCLIPSFFYTRGAELSDIEFESLGEELILPYVRPDHPYAAIERLEDTAGIRWAVPHQLSVSYRFESAFYRNKHRFRFCVVPRWKATWRPSSQLVTPRRTSRRGGSPFSTSARCTSTSCSASWSGAVCAPQQWLRGSRNWFARHSREAGAGLRSTWTPLEPCAAARSSRDHQA
jgi:DNA-binding transcriptional LysR family regulator